MLTLHNFSSRRQTIALDPKTDASGLLVDVFDENQLDLDVDGGPR